MQHDDNKIRHGEYTEVEYLQFSAGQKFRTVRALLGALTWPLTWPLAMLARRSEFLFRTMSELLSVIPYLIGVITRYEFYRFALRHCGKNVLIEFGAIFIYPDVSIGNNVLIGRYSIVHHCDFGDYVLTGERCTFLSGSRQHSYDRTDMPMALQGGKKKRIMIGDDCWIGSHAVVMNDVGAGAIVGAGTVVLKPVANLAIVAGNPAREVGRRGE
ncbi:MAG: acyltransferase [Acidiferrobacterales bacterium]